MITKTTVTSMPDYKIEIDIDDFPTSPIEDSDLIVFARHNRYSLGNCKNLPIDAPVETLDQLKEACDKLHIAGYFADLISLYDHSGLSIYRGSPTCPWDSGYVGIIAMKQSFFDGEGLAMEYIDDILRQYTSYLNGECYVARIIDSDTGDCVDVSGTYYDKDKCIEDAKAQMVLEGREFEVVDNT